MSHNLLIVESPAKARTIQRYVGPRFKVFSTIGHIRDLPTKTLGVDIRNNFKPLYVPVPGKKAVISKLKKEAAEAEAIYLATDPDREGEAIGWHVTQILKDLKKPFHRVQFMEITPAGIKRGLDNPQPLDERRVQAQQARRIIDRLVGFKISPFLWKVLYSGLSAGRVQAVALRLVCERQEEIDNFVPQEYWTIEALLETPSGSSFKAELHKVDDRKIKIENETQAQEFVALLGKATFQVQSLERKQTLRQPPPPFTTSTLQQAAFQKLHLRTKSTMAIAQQLYEGVPLPDGKTLGLITYMRTDSVRLAPEAVAAAREFIGETFGKEYLPARARVFKKGGRNVQDAHEAIRPTHPELTPDMVRATLKPEQARLYELIWRRFMASQMAAARFEQTQANILADARFLLRAKGQRLLFPGFLKVYPEDQEESTLLPDDLDEGQNLTLKKLDPKQHFTKPPAPYTESTLVKKLDQEGIGRPSTYAQIISVIQTRGYVRSEKRKLYPTELGKITNKLLVEHFPELVNVSFTRTMEEELDLIELGKREHLQVLEEFWHHLEAWLEASSKAYREIKASLQQTTDEVCEKCGQPMVIKWGRNGRFLACSGFPKCRNARPLPEDDETNQHNEAETAVEGGTCEKCGQPLVLRSGRYGKFYACSNYPACKYTRPAKVLMPCPRPDCTGQIVPRRTKKGRTFYGCTAYPKCDFVSWDPPVPSPCPACGASYRVEKHTTRSGTYYYCPQCKHKEPLSQKSTSPAE